MKKNSKPKLKIPKFIVKTTSYLHILILFFYSVLTGTLIVYAGVYSSKEPTTLQVEEKRNSLDAKKIDQSALDKLKELESRNISLDALFDNGRTNPFEN